MHDSEGVQWGVVLEPIGIHFVMHSGIASPKLHLPHNRTVRANTKQTFCSTPCGSNFDIHPGIGFGATESHREAQRATERHSHREPQRATESDREQQSAKGQGTRGKGRAARGKGQGAEGNGARGQGPGARGKEQGAGGQGPGTRGRPIWLRL